MMLNKSNQTKQKEASFKFQLKLNNKKPKQIQLNQTINYDILCSDANASMKSRTTSFRFQEVYHISLRDSSDNIFVCRD